MKQLIHIDENTDMEKLIHGLSKHFDKITMKTSSNGDKTMILEQSETKAVMASMKEPMLWFKWG